MDMKHNNDGIFNILSSSKWLICQDEYVPELNLRYETNFTLANGYMGTRGSFEEGSDFECPGNFIAGVYDKSDAQVREIVNTQNWLGVKIYVNGRILSLDENSNKVLGIQRFSHEMAE
jgi:kojibiose phosphorylase